MKKLNSLSLSVSLVLYKPDLVTLERTVFSLKEAADVAKADFDLTLALTLVDNSNDPEVHANLGRWFQSRRLALVNWTVNLVLSPGNIGYGRGNNLVIESANSDYHLVVNPDLFVAPDALKEALHFLESHCDTGLLTPAVYGEDGERHYICKRYPTLLIMFLRSFAPAWLQVCFKSTLAKFEMRDCDYSKPIFDVEYPTGACMFFRTSVLKKIGGFDPDYFLHYEDADIGRRALQVARVMYVPSVKVVHQWARDTHRSRTAMLLTMRSGLLYWRKWGGIFSSKPTPVFVDEKPVIRTEPASAQLAGAGRGELVLVTGANGFIGQAVCADLPFRGYRVRAVVRHQHQISAHHDVEYLSINAMDSEMQWGAALQGVDSVIHLAARVHLMRETALSPLTEFRRTNVALTLNLARQAAAAGVRRFIFISSIKVNGEATPVGQPFNADDTPQPTDPYGISKYEAEVALLELAAQTQMEVVIIRPVLVYGAGVKANFQTMMRCVVKQLPLPLGALHNQRSLLAIDNLVDLIVLCLKHPAAANQIFLASDGEDVSVTGLLQRMAQAFGRRAYLVPVPAYLLHAVGRLLGQSAVTKRLYDTLQVDIYKTKSLLGWTPPTSLNNALRKIASQIAGK